MPFIFVDVVTSLFAVGPAVALAGFYWRWWRGSPERDVPGSVRPLVIAAFSLWVVVRTVIPLATTIAEPASRSWRVPPSAVANVLGGAVLIAVCRSVAERQEAERAARWRKERPGRGRG